jgi:hypothetical protein
MKHSLFIHSLLVLFTTLLLWSCAQEVSIPTDNLVAYYPFNGDVKDYSGYQNDGIAEGVTFTTDRHNKANSACTFGSSAWIDVPQSSTLTQTDDKSMSVWVYLPANENLVMYPTLISKADNDYQTYCIQLNASDGYGVNQYKFDFFFGSGTTNYLCNSVENYTDYTNKWVHIVATYSKSEGVSKIYINGALSNTVNVGSFSSNYSNGDLYIGKAGNIYGQTFFTGYMDDIRIYKRVLTQQEIEALYKE